MKKWYYVVSLMLAVLLILGGLTAAFAQEEGKSKTIVFIPKSTDVTYWLFISKGATDKASELGYTVD